MEEALREGLVTGFTKSPDYYKATARIFGTNTALDCRGQERHTHINTDKIIILRSMVAQKDKAKAFEFLNAKLSTKWDTPLIKVTEKGVNKKFKEYLDQNVKKDGEKK